MKERKRLTYRGQEYNDQMYKKLQMLEDKIEDGELVDKEFVLYLMDYVSADICKNCTYYDKSGKCTSKKYDNAICLQGIKERYEQANKK